MKTLIAILILIPSLSWGGTKSLVCEIDTKNKKSYNIFHSLGFKINDNTKEFSYYRITKNSDGEFFVKSYVGVHKYNEFKDHLHFTRVQSYLNSRYAVNRKNLKLNHVYQNGVPSNIVIGQCKIVNNEKKIIKDLNRIIKNEMDRNLI